MPFRSILLCLPVAAFLASTLFGLHFHMGEEHGHGTSAPESGHVHLAAEFTSAHVAEHLTDDAVDVGNSKAGVPLQSSLTSLVLAAAIYCSLILLVPLRRGGCTRFFEPPLRPPRRAHFLPPSQAPPCSA